MSSDSAGRIEGSRFEIPAAVSITGLMGGPGVEIRGEIERQAICGAAVSANALRDGAED